MFTFFETAQKPKHITTICISYFVIIATLFLGSCGSTHKNVKKSFTHSHTNQMQHEGWQKEFWSPKEYYTIASSERSAGIQLIIDADTMTYSRWYQNVQVIPYSTYSFTGWIKTHDVYSDIKEAGAGFRLGSKSANHIIPFKGTNDWTKVEFTFDTGGDDSVVLECILGLRGASKGKAYFEDISLTHISSTPLSPSLTIDISRPLEPMSELIYGQFIEHMGNCIYGGIWAEMLSDRKFFFKPGTKESPWKVTGGNYVVSLHTQQPYNGDHDPVIQNQSDSGNGFYQTGLHLQQQKRYVGRLVAHIEPEALPLIVELSWDEYPLQKQEIVIEEPAIGYRTHHFEFVSPRDTKNGTFRMLLQGKGKAKIAAVSLMPDDNIYGFRKDVLELMKSLESPVYRWPGGNFVSGYNWMDGIGDPDKRPTRYEKAWEGWDQHFPVEPNDMGLDEFMLLCKLLDAKANIAVNTGLGTPEEAALQVEYANGSIDTPMGALRAAHGHKAPYNVKLWAVGNEMFGDWQLGVMPVEEYVHKHNETARLMWKADPSIELIAVGYPGAWNEAMYKHSANYMTHISEHFYRQDWHGGGLMTHVKQIPDAIREIAQEHRNWRNTIPGLKEKDIKIAMDEWNYWYGPHVYGLLGTRYFLRDALGIAAGINEFLRQSDIYMMANYAQTVNVIGAIKATPTESFMEGTGMVLRMYRQKFGLIPLKAQYDTAPLDVAAALTKDQNYLTISVINPTLQDQPLSLTIHKGQIQTTGTLYYITGNDSMDFNEVQSKKIRQYTLPVNLDDDLLHIPALSASIFRFQLKP